MGKAFKLLEKGGNKSKSIEIDGECPECEHHRVRLTKRYYCPKWLLFSSMLFLCEKAEVREKALKAYIETTDKAYEVYKKRKKDVLV